MTSKKTRALIKMEHELAMLKKENGEGVWRTGWDVIPGWCDILIDQMPHGVVSGLKRVVAVSRGGFIPAAIIAHKLQVYEVRSIWISSYCDEVQAKVGEPKLEGPLQLEWDDPSTLIIDDILDSGETARVIREQFSKAHFGALVVRYDPRQANFYGVMIATSRWVVFPWEE